MTAPSDRPTGMRPPQPDQTGQTQGSHSLYLQGHHPDTGSKPNASQQSIKDSASSTPPPGKGRDDLSEIDVRALAQKQEELQSKYSKVKRLYYEKDAQVQHLQNTIAHQRMAVSRTVLDDNEYTNRFSRLEGAIKELAFSIRKEWTDIPTWLQAHVNSDAQGKEMTAVGRAVISRWLVDEIFQRYFHPALDPTFSMQLKTIELNLRRQQGNKAYTDEDKENAVARISNWRCTTLDGLAEALQGAPAEEHRAQLIHYLAEKLVASLAMHLVTPPPPELDNAALMIVENSMNIAEKIPLESRDICVEYFLPGTPVSERSMKVETGLPPLTTAVQPADPAAGDATLQDDGASPATELERGRNSSENSAQSQGTTSAPTVPVKEGKKKSVFGSLIGGGGSSSGGGTATARPSSALAKDKERDEADSGTERVRLATFVHVEVRGRGPTNVLAKTPVYV
ncbi:hypothetical protein ASPZODRAFT_1395059 [Penicilliopsis zonata CBS 506.65]|uniref:Uncharacterized protein n=1 Tax=Penicilliopsis zonata CBS 506.65 TaxID=1073090 RepID=A0A1L9SPR3_9EURO|nr:hypothetical protein ASPZODRAFT_1395059 [Penicilliopsis zonata CBS 506.65]OJJ49091.1 hypothetical protein ASPZODRAFT_1395059 [Penicilliopsis zonata CBS 506.65]